MRTAAPNNAKTGLVFLQRAWAARPLSSYGELAELADCELSEVYDAMVRGAGHGPSGLPEPRVLHSICGVLGASYPEAMLAFGHLVARATK